MEKERGREGDGAEEVGEGVREGEERYIFLHVRTYMYMYFYNLLPEC